MELIELGTRYGALGLGLGLAFLLAYSFMSEAGKALWRAVSRNPKHSMFWASLLICAFAMGLQYTVMSRAFEDNEPMFRLAQAAFQSSVYVTWTAVLGILILMSTLALELWRIHLDLQNLKRSLSEADKKP